MVKGLIISGRQESERLRNVATHIFFVMEEAMDKIRSLNLFQKVILFIMLGMTLIFTAVYTVTLSRVGFQFQNTIFVPGEGDHGTLYTGKMGGKKAEFTVSDDKTVLFQLGEKVYGPYSVKEDPGAIPQENELTDYIKGVEIFRGDKRIFRGSYLQIDEFVWIDNEDGTPANIGVTYTTDNGSTRDMNGDIVDPYEPSISTILELAYGPKLTHKGSWNAWFWAVLVCILNTLSMLFAEELFRWNLSFRIRSVEHAEPSDWEIANRNISWGVLTVMAMVLFLTGLQ